LVAVPLVWDAGLKGTLRFTSVVPQAFSHEDLRYASEAAALLLPLLSQG
jgi:putative methionine-R-sulfoxide reductase with GAF domain